MKDLGEGGWFSITLASLVPFSITLSTPSMGLLAEHLLRHSMLVSARANN